MFDSASENGIRCLSPFVLPEGNVQVAFSGGRTSAYMLHRVLEANGGLPDRAVVSFQNTGRERDETLDFVAEVGARWAVPIVWLEYRAAKPLFEVVSHNSASRNGEPFDQLIKKRQMLPNQHKKFCSLELKTLTAKRFLVAHGWRSWTSFVGFRADEPHRTPFVDNRATTRTPLVTARVTKHTVAEFWRRQPFDLRLPLINGKTLGGNCDWCFQKSEAVIAAGLRDELPRARWWLDHEDRSGHGFSDRFLRRELLDVVRRQADMGFSDEEFFCQARGGECY